jgi:hypothetical protein
MYRALYIIRLEKQRLLIIKITKRVTGPDAVPRATCNRSSFMLNIHALYTAA